MWLQRELPNAPWETWVQRVVIHVPTYLSAHGEPTSGGLQRKVRDLAGLIRDKWGRDVVIVQRGATNWERLDSHGNRVVAIRSRLDSLGDPSFGYHTSRFLQKDDAIIYMGQEDAWPFFVRGSKGFHAGIWWDGPQATYKKWIAGIRTEAFFRACRSVLCVDTNVINWLRARGRKNQDIANRAVYVPNSVDLERVPQKRRTAPENPIRVLFARRYELKRGPQVALDAAKVLIERGVPIRLIMSTARGRTGTDAILQGARQRGIADHVEAHENDLDSVFSLYSRADVALVPTLWSEGTSYSCAEALAAGLPVVTTTVGGLPNLVIPGFNGLVVPPRPEPIADAIESLTSPDRWLELHQNALSMRSALSKDLWEERVLQWLKS